MKRHPVRKGLVGLTAALALLVVSVAQPAGAAAVEDGTLMFGGTPASPTLTFPLGASAPAGPCEPTFNETQPFEIAEWEEGDPGTWAVEGGFVTTYQLLGNWIKAEFDLSGISGQMTPTADPGEWDLTGGGVATLDLYNVRLPDDFQDPCEKEDLICQMSAEMVLLPVSHRHKTGDTHWPGDHFYWNLDSVAPHLVIGFFDCDFVIWLTLNGLPVYVRDLVISLP